MENESFGTNSILTIPTDRLNTNFIFDRNNEQKNKSRIGSGHSSNAKRFRPRYKSNSKDKFVKRNRDFSIELEKNSRIDKCAFVKQKSNNIAINIKNKDKIKKPKPANSKNIKEKKKMNSSSYIFTKVIK